MLRVTIPRSEWYDEETERFVVVDSKTIQLEHSLISLSKWESKWKKPYLNPKTPITQEEFIDYIRCMTITPNVDPMVYLALTPALLDEIQRYINDKMTATWFNKDHARTSPIRSRTITSELVYYWMIAHNIPAEYQKWHLNRLLTLIEVCNEESAPKKKMSPADQAKQMRELNNQRRKELNTRG